MRYNKTIGSANFFADEGNFFRLCCLYAAEDKIPQKDQQLSKGQKTWNF